MAEFAGPTESAPERFVAYDAQCLRSFTRGEYAEARGLAETFLREAEAERRATEAGAARRMLGLILLHQGELKAARSVLERALADYVPQGSSIAMVHTEVVPAHENEGLATKVVDAALADVRARGLRVVPACSFVRLHVRRHAEEYADIL